MIWDIVTSVGTLGAAAFAGWAAWTASRANKQSADLVRLERDRDRQAEAAALDARISELQAVTLSYRVLKPHRAKPGDGTGDYVYGYTVHNPGRLPITGVAVQMHYPGPVSRVHAHSVRATEDAQTDHTMKAAAVAARGTFAWKRTLSVPRDLWGRMEETTADLTFRTADAGLLRTTWPATGALPSVRLRSRIPQENLAS